MYAVFYRFELVSTSTLTPIKGSKINFILTKHSQVDILDDTSGHIQAYLANHYGVVCIYNEEDREIAKVNNVRDFFLRFMEDSILVQLTEQDLAFIHTVNVTNS